MLLDLQVGTWLVFRRRKGNLSDQEVQEKD